MRRMLFSWAGLAIAAVLLIGLNVLSFHLFRGLRVDVTENRAYTLTQGTREILASLEEPVTLEFYYSRRRATVHAPGLAPHMTRVQDLLQEYRDVSGGMVRLRIVDPEPFSEEEDEAALAGLAGIPAGPAGDPLFAGLVGRNLVDERAVIPFFDPQREPFLEYELTKLVYELSSPRRPTLGILTTLPMFGETTPQAPMRDPRMQRGPWVITDQLRQFHEVLRIDNDADEIPADVDLLMVVHPRDLPEETLYAIDQFVLGGGNALVFVDPHAEADEAPFDPDDPYANLWRERGSTLEPLLAAWGIAFDPALFVADRGAAQRVSYADERGLPETIDFLAYLLLDGDRLNSEDVITAGIGEVTFGTAGALLPREGATTEFIPLATSTTNAALMDIETMRLTMNPRQLLNDFVSADESYTLAARISGPVETAFPDWPSRFEPEPEEETGLGEDLGDGPAARTHLERSNGNINVVVFADTDFLTDRFWVQLQNFMGQRIAFPVASNGDMVLNAVENLAGSDALISVRARGRHSRPFERVDEMRKAAEDRFRERQQELEQRLVEIESEINELQRARTDAASPFLLTEEQTAMLEQAREEQVETRRELREVRRQLEREIDELGTRLKVLNIAAIPVLVSLAAIGLGIARQFRRRRR